jgi:hypothetical protein
VCYYFLLAEFDLCYEVFICWDGRSRFLFFISTGFAVANVQTVILTPCVTYSGMEISTIVPNMLRNKLMLFDRQGAAKSQYRLLIHRWCWEILSILYFQVQFCILKALEDRIVRNVHIQHFFCKVVRNGLTSQDYTCTRGKWKCIPGMWLFTQVSRYTFFNSSFMTGVIVTR